ncbi:unnamed protein product, partial [Ectocarpus fasciculatus]
RLPNRAAFDVQQGPERRQQREHICEASVGSVVWPRSLKRLAISQDMPIHTVSWPAFLQQLSFGKNFNQPIVGRRGQPPCSSYRLEVSLTRPSSERRGRPPCSSYR